jgi:hypothetical protein
MPLFWLIENRVEDPLLLALMSAAAVRSVALKGVGGAALSAGTHRYGQRAE